MTHGALVLCGGRSTRMGRDKAWLELGDEPLLARVVRRLRPAVGEIVVVARGGQALPPLPPNVVVARDEEPDLGPLAGLAFGLAACSADIVYATACDAPFLSAGFVTQVLDAVGEEVDVAVVEQEGFLHPLAAAYRTALAPTARRLLADGKRRPRDLFDTVRTTRIAAEALRDVDPDLASLENVNTPEAWQAAVERVAARPPRVVIELYESARGLAGIDMLEVEAATLGQALAELGRRHPTLEGTVVDAGRLAPHWRASVGGKTFTDDPATPLAPGDHVVIVSALAGG